jgi:hypothetical protein
MSPAITNALPEIINVEILTRASQPPIEMSVLRSLPEARTNYLQQRQLSSAEQTKACSEVTTVWLALREVLLALWVRRLVRYP